MKYLKSFESSYRRNISRDSRFMDDMKYILLELEDVDLRSSSENNKIFIRKKTLKRSAYPNGYEMDIQDQRDLIGFFNTSLTHETIQRIKNFVSTNYTITIDVEVSNRPGHFGYGYRTIHYSVDEFLKNSIEAVAVIVNFEKSKGYKVVG